MSTTTTVKKRKSADSTTAVSKKVKITKSADKPAPLKSALKKSKTATTSSKPSQNGSISKKSAKKTPKPSVPEPEENEDAEEQTDLTPDQTAALLAGFSSDSDAEDEDSSGVPLSSLPKAPTTALQTTTSTTSKDSEDPENTPAVLYIGRIPHGFYESQMRAYFSQFGTITNLRLARNKKTGKSQHYAFVEFASAAVAEIVRKTMDKYLLAGRLLQVRNVPRELVRENCFAGSGRKGRKRAPRNRMEGRRLARGMEKSVWEGRVERERARRVEKGGKLAELGYQFDMPGVRGVEDVPVKVQAGEVVGGAEAEAGEGVKLLTNGDVEAQESTVTEEKVTKKRPASEKTETKKKVKKVKT